MLQKISTTLMVFSTLITLILISKIEGGTAYWGDVNWIRNFNDACWESNENNKPIFLQFQEDPG